MNEHCILIKFAMEICVRPNVAYRLRFTGAIIHCCQHALQILELERAPSLDILRYLASWKEELWVSAQSAQLYRVRAKTRVWSEIVPSRWYWRTYNNIVALLHVARDWKDPANVCNTIGCTNK